MKKRFGKSTLFLALVAIVAVLALSACGSSNTASNSSEAPVSEGTPAASGETKKITITASNFEFDTKEIKAKVGDTIILTLKNDNGTHGLAIDDLNVNIKNGESATIVLDKAGTYDYNCSVMCGTGHDAMSGQLIVE